MLAQNGEMPEMITSFKWEDSCFATINVQGMPGALADGDDGFASLGIAAPGVRFKCFLGPFGLVTIFLDLY